MQTSSTAPLCPEFGEAMSTIQELVRKLDQRMIASRRELLLIAARLRDEADKLMREADMLELEGNEILAGQKRIRSAELIKDAANFCLMAKCRVCGSEPCCCDGN